MSIVRKLAIGVGGLLGLLVVAGAGTYLWASSAASSKLTATHDVHRVEFPIPFSLTESELAEVRAERAAAGPRRARGADPLAGVDLNALATERAVSRGKHLLQSFYGCAECHGADFGGGVMVDEPNTVGRLLGPNLTLGTGSRTLEYSAADWDRMVRHGVKPNGTGSPMPSKDFFAMSDRELSDVVSYIRSLPPVNKQVAPVALGPVGKMLVAMDRIVLSADMHPTNHVIEHAALPPTAVADATFGKHLAQTCTGCHGVDLTGGPINGGPPEWPPARNLTQAGLVGWTYDDFVRALKEGKSKNGVALREPMANMGKFASNMTETELRALWAYIKELPARPAGG